MRVLQLFLLVFVAALLSTTSSVAQERQTKEFMISRTLGAPGTGFSASKVLLEISGKELLEVKVFLHQARSNVESAVYLQIGNESPLEVQFLQGSDEQHLLWELKGRKLVKTPLWLKVEKGAVYVERAEVSYLTPSQK